MFHVAFPRGQRPAFPDLPPTLQPCAIAASAPHADRVRTLTLSGLIYLSLVAGAMALSMTAPRVLPISRPPVDQGRIVVFDHLPPVSRPPVSTTTQGGGGNTSEPSNSVRVVAPQPDPTEAPDGLPTKDRHNEIPGVGPSRPGPEVPSGPGSTGPAVTSSFQEVSVTGLAVLFQVDPAYPEFARKARIQGPVVLKMTVDERGQPTQVQVLEGHSVFHEAAMAAARQWRFEPARVDGRPVAASFRLTVRFTLK